MFGRGGEELLACREAGVDCEVIPGVTRRPGRGAPARGAPSTHRGLAQAVTFVTGHAAAAGEGGASPSSTGADAGQAAQPRWWPSIWACLTAPGVVAGALIAAAGAGFHPGPDRRERQPG